MAGSSGIVLAGSGSVLVAAGCEDPDEAVAVLVLLTIGVLGVAATAYAINEDIGGNIELINTSSRDQSGNVRLGVIHGSGVIVDGAHAKYSVRAGFANTYQWTGLRSDRSGEHHARAESHLNVVDSPTFNVT